MFKQLQLEKISKISKSLRSRLDEDIYSPRIDVVLLIIGLASAIVDTLTITILKVSIAHNTLNILILAMGTTGLQVEYPSLIRPSRAATALISSWIGSFLVGRIGRYVNFKKRGALFYNFAFQAFLVYLTSILLWTNVLSLFNNTNHVFLAMLAFTFGVQFASTKLLHPLGCAAIPAQVISGDPNLFSGFSATGTRSRNCRIAFLFTFFSGGIVGGLLITHHINPAVILCLVASLKLVASLILLILPADVTLPLVADPITTVIKDVDEITCFEIDSKSEKGSSFDSEKGQVIVTSKIV